MSAGPGRATTSTATLANRRRAAVSEPSACPRLSSSRSAATGPTSNAAGSTGADPESGRASCSPPPPERRSIPNFRRLVKEVAARAEIGHLAPHDLRHTAASLLSDAGVPNHELVDLLGHTTTRMVEVHYRHRLTETIDVAIGPMDRLLGGEPS